MAAARRGAKGVTEEQHPLKSKDSSQADPMMPRPHRVRSLRRETHDTLTMTLEPEDGGGSTGFEPGQFNMLYSFGIGEAAISISGDPARRGVILHTIREVGAVTRALGRLRRGGIVGVRGPFGTAWPVGEMEGRDVLLVAGGIGMAPLRPVMRAALARRRKVERLVLLYGARTPGDILYRRELEAESARGRMDLQLTVDSSGEGWRGRVGVVPALVARAALDPGRALAMVCGPEIMMRYTIIELLRRGLQPAQIHLSMERNMKCAVGFCGHCQYGPEFICRDGPVFRYERIRRWLNLREF